MSEIASIVSARGATAMLKRHKVVASESLHTKANTMFKAPQMIAVLWLLNGALVPPAGAQSVARQAGQAQTSGVDASIRPGDDFFAYANGEWLKATPIPAGQQRVGAFSQIAALTQERVVQLLADAKTAAPGSSARTVADFHAAFLNQAVTEAKGLAALQPLFKDIDRVRDKAALTRLLGRGLRADVDPLNQGIYRSAHVLGLAVQASNHGEKYHRAFLLQGGLGLPDRTHYLGVESGVQALRTQYQAYVGDVLVQAGYGDGMQNVKRAQSVLALETATAQSHASSEVSAEDHNADNVWTRADFARLAPGLDWRAFFQAAGLARQNEFVAWQPSAVTGLAALLAAQPLQVWKDYLRLQVIHQHADVLPRAIAEPAQALRAAAAGTPPAGDGAAARERLAIDATQSALHDALGRLYVQRHFPAEDKARVQAITANVITAFGQRLEAVTWLSPATKTQALAKLKTVYFGVGYPAHWPDPWPHAQPNDPALLVDPADALGNLQRVAQRNYRQALSRLGQRTDPRVWVLPAQRPGGVLLFHQNAYNFSAALLQAPKFDPGESDAANYGAIGAIVGHELSHFIDTLGADYEADGRMRRWWTADDLARYHAATEPLVQQFSAYQPLADLAVDGKLTLTENLADLGGLAAAFDAYRRTLRSTGDLRQQDRAFFIGFARAWRSKSTEAALRKQIASDGHAPDNTRVATVRNIDAWYDAFDVLPGQRLYLEPKARVRVW